MLVAFASIHGNTAHAAHKLAQLLEEKGAKKVSVMDLSRCDMAEAVEDGFRYSHLALANGSPMFNTKNGKRPIIRDCP